MPTICRLGATLRWTLVVLVLLSLVAWHGGARAEPITRVDSIGITVADMDRALDFYTRVCRSR
jgi:hypothetical protein